MKWPWSKEVEHAQEQAKEAAEGHAHSIQLRQEVEAEREKAVQVNRVLRRELERNGFTDLMLEAWGGHAR